jgi:hypothetical protein
MKMTATLLLSTLSLAGCGGINGVLRDEQKVVISKDTNPMKDPSDLGSVYAWLPHTSVLVIDGKGNRCVRTAAAARVTGGSSEFDASIEGLKKLQSLTVGSTSTVEQSQVRLIVPSDVANMLDVVLFGHCIQDMNGTFKNENSWKAAETMKLYTSAMDVIRQYVVGQQRGGSSTDPGLTKAGSASSAGAKSTTSGDANKKDQETAK